jgi:hypothetical protein
VLVYMLGLVVGWANLEWGGAVYQSSESAPPRAGDRKSCCVSAVPVAIVCMVFHGMQLLWTCAL